MGTFPGTSTTGFTELLLIYGHLDGSCQPEATWGPTEQQQGHEAEFRKQHP